MARRGGPCHPLHRLLKKAGDTGSVPCTVSHQQRWVQPWFILLPAQDGAWSGCCSWEWTAAGPQDPTVTHAVLGPCGRPSLGLGLCPCLQGSVPSVLRMELPRGHQSGATDREWTRQSAVPIRGLRMRASGQQSSACSDGALGRQRHAELAARGCSGSWCPVLSSSESTEESLSAHEQSPNGDRWGGKGLPSMCPGHVFPPSEGLL